MSSKYTVDEQLLIDYNDEVCAKLSNKVRELLQEVAHERSLGHPVNDLLAQMEKKRTIVPFTIGQGFIDEDISLNEVSTAARVVINAIQHYKVLNILTNICFETALETEQKLSIEKKNNSLLYDRLILIKDNFCLCDTLTCASKMLANFRSPYTVRNHFTSDHKYFYKSGFSGFSSFK